MFLQWQRHYTFPESFTSQNLTVNFGGSITNDKMVRFNTRSEKQMLLKSTRRMLSILGLKYSYFQTIGIKSRKLKISKWKIKVYFTTCIQKHIAHQTTKIKKGGEKRKKRVERKCERYSTED